MTSDETRRIDPADEPGDESDLIREALATDYEIVQELGRGGMAVVYLARERALERDVAIKVLPIARTFDAELVARFQREARLLASLEHAHIVPVYRVGQSGRVNFFVMKHMRGPSVAELLRTDGPMAAAEVERLLLEVSDALDHAHAHGVIHRDVKPDNVMKDQTGRYVVMDFGIAKTTTGSQLTQAGGSIGTPKYMSPEQAKGSDLDGRSDFYSLGIVGYECLVGRAPFDGDDPMSILYAHLHEPVPDPTLDSIEAQRVFTVVAGLLAKDPLERLGSGAEIRAALHTSSPGRTPAPSRTTRPAAVDGAMSALPPWLRRRDRRFWMAAGAGAVVLVALFGRNGAASQCRAAMPEASDDDRAILLEPPGTVPRGTDIALAYVVCGLSGDAPFTIRATIGPADQGGVVGRVGRFFGGGGEPYRETWDDEADGFATTRERTISPGDLGVGSYRITLQVEDREGRDAEARHDFTVVEP